MFTSHLTLDALISLKNILADGVHLSVAGVKECCEFRGAIAGGNVPRRIPRYAVLAVLAAVRSAAGTTTKILAHRSCGPTRRIVAALNRRRRSQEKAA